MCIAGINHCDNLHQVAAKLFIEWGLQSMPLNLFESLSKIQLLDNELDQERALEELKRELQAHGYSL